MSGYLGRLKGKHNELRLVDLVNMLPRPEWIQGACTTSEAKDKRGLDVAVITDVGPLYLQVKSSAREASAFRSKYKFRVNQGAPPVAVVVLSNGKSEETIRRQTFYLLSVMREGKINKCSKLIYTLPNHWSVMNDSGCDVL